MPQGNKIGGKVVRRSPKVNANATCLQYILRLNFDIDRFAYLTVRNRLFGGRFLLLSSIYISLPYNHLGLQ